MTGPSQASATPTLRAGFMPLTDAAPLIVAARMGFAEEEGLALELIRETSWATLRDRMAVRHLDIAHMLAPMPLADALGLTPLPIGLVVPMALGFGGNTVTVSAALARELAAEGAPGTGEAAPTAAAMARVVTARRWSSRPRITFAIVHPYSAHHYQLAYWLAWAGISPVADVDLVVLPPPLMAAALAAGQIDGFCAGEPWGSAAVAEGAGRIVTTSTQIWRRGPEKVLGVRAQLASEDASLVARLVRAVFRAARWCDEPANQPELAHLLAEPAHIGQPAGVIRAGLAKRPGVGAHAIDAGPGFLGFAIDGATLPRPSHAAWFYAQMVRWGQIGLDDGRAARAQGIYRPDIYRAALAPLGAATGATDAAGTAAIADAVDAASLFDGRPFDPRGIADYLGQFAVRGAP